MNSSGLGVGHWHWAMIGVGVVLLVGCGDGKARQTPDENGGQDVGVAEDVAVVDQPDDGVVDGGGGENDGGHLDVGPFADVGTADTGEPDLGFDVGSDVGPADGGGSDVGTDSGVPPDGDMHPSLSALLRALDDTENPGAREELVAEGISQMQAGPGLPLLEGNQVTFVWLDDHHARPLTVAGDFNSWNAAILPMERAAKYPRLAWAVIDLTPTQRCSYYKVVASGGEQWLADPRSRRFHHDSEDGAPISLVGGCADQGHLERVGPLWWAGLGDDRPVTMWVPPGYESPENQNRQYPILIMHDGQNLWDPRGMNWDVANAAQMLVSQGLVEPLLIVGIPHSVDRMYQYIPHDVPDIGGGGADEYGDFLEGELLPTIKGRYRIEDGPQRTGIAGSSLGGLVSFYLGYTRPHVFGQVMSFSGSFWLGEPYNQTDGLVESMRQMVLRRPAGQAPDLRIYLDSGTRGNDNGDDAPCGDARCYTEWLRNTLISKGWDWRSEYGDTSVNLEPPASPGDDATHWWQPVPQNPNAYLRPDLNMLHLVAHEHGHHEHRWAQRLYGGLMFLFPGSIQ